MIVIKPTEVRVNNKYVYSILYCIIAGLGATTIQMVHIGIQTASLIFVVSVITISIFHIFYFKSILSAYRKCLQHPLLVVGLNFSVLGIWYLCYKVILLSDAAYGSIVFFFIVGLLSNLFSIKANKLKIITIIGIVLMISWFIQISILALALAILAGVCGYVSNIFAKKLSMTAKFSVKEVLLIRFWALLVFAFYILPTNFIAEMSPSILCWACLIAVMTLIIQQWLNQMSIIKAGISWHGYITAFTPFTTFICEGLIFQNWSLSLLLVSLSVPLLFIPIAKPILSATKQLLASFIYLKIFLTPITITIAPLRMSEPTLMPE